MPRAADPTIKIMGLTGMDNLRKTRGYLLNDAKMATPRTVMNADALDGGVIVPRGGFAKILSLPSPHSLWSGSAMLCVSQGWLHRIDGTGITEIDYVGDAPLQYEEWDGGQVYMSSTRWKGVYDIGMGTVRGWGVPIPTTPSASAVVTGDLPPGVYKIAYTRVANGMLSGNSDIAEVGWEGRLGGIHLSNKPADCAVWITQANGVELFMATVDGSGNITNPHYTIPLPTFGNIPPPRFSSIVSAHGRLWGVNGKDVWYSDEFRPDYFRASGKFSFPFNVVSLAKYDAGIYVNSRPTTWSLAGTDPSKMTQHDLGGGAIDGNVVYEMVEGAGYEISKHLTQVPSPVWVSPTGVIVGTHTGHLVHITEMKLWMAPRKTAAGLARKVNGRQQVLFTLTGPLTGPADTATVRDFKRGRLFVPATATLRAYGGVQVGGHLEES